VAVLIPSIDLMGSKIVQLVQGEKKALEFDDFEPWLERFSKYPLVQIVDLDAALGQGDNRLLVRSLVQRLRCQVGGGFRTAERAREMLEEGALRVVIGSALIKDGSLARLARRSSCSPQTRRAGKSRSGDGGSLLKFPPCR
jgi:phosphoribosylformimino-5-aminoimidazole carboxamide ribotide isomerase